MSPGRRGGRGGGRSPSRKTRKKGVLSGLRLVGAVVAVTAVAAVGVNLSLMETDEIDSLGDPSRRWSGQRVRVEVYNAGGVTGMARAATEELRDVGFDVVTFDNADRFDPERPSEVIDRVGRLEIARAVAEALRIGNVHSDPDPNLYVEVTVVVGRDWVGPEGLRLDESDEDDSAWWDPRDWF